VRAVEILPKVNGGEGSGYLGERAKERRGRGQWRDGEEGKGRGWVEASRDVRERARG